MANVVINGGQLSTNIRNVVLTITSPPVGKTFVYATEVADITAFSTSNIWTDTSGVDPFTMYFVVSPGTGTKTVYVHFASDGAGTGWVIGERVYDSIELYANIRLPVITYPLNGAEVTNRSIIVQGTAEVGATVTVKVEALN